MRLACVLYLLARKVDRLEAVILRRDPRRGHLAFHHPLPVGIRKPRVPDHLDEAALTRADPLCLIRGEEAAHEVRALYGDRLLNGLAARARAAAIPGIEDGLLELLLRGGAALLELDDRAEDLQSGGG